MTPEGAAVLFDRQEYTIALPEVREPGLYWENPRPEPDAVIPLRELGFDFAKFAAGLELENGNGSDTIPAGAASLAMLFEQAASNFTCDDIYLTFTTNPDGTREVAIAVGSSQAADTFSKIPDYNYDRPMSTMEQVDISDNPSNQQTMDRYYHSLTGEAPSGPYDIHYQLNSARKENGVYANLYVTPEGQWMLAPLRYPDEYIYYVGPGGVIADLTDQVLYSHIALPQGFAELLQDQLPLL